MPDTDSETPADPDDPVTYQFEIDREEWEQWSNTVPRQTPLSARLRDLIRQDARSAARADRGDVSDKSVSLLASRIRIRATQALGAVRDGDDREKAIEELQDILELAQALED